MSATPIGATVLVGALNNIADSVKLFGLLLSDVPAEERVTWDDALHRLLRELQDCSWDSTRT